MELIGMRHIAAFAVAAAVLGATAACTGSSGSPTSGGTSTAGTTLSPSTTTTTVNTQASGTSTATAATTTGAANSTSNGSNSTSGSNTVSGGTTSCNGSEIKVSLGNGDAAMSHDGLALVFTNTSSQACTMQGYPGAAIMSGSTLILNATRSLNGYIGDERQLSSAPLVTLAPGAKASAILEYVADAGETCYPSGSGTLEVTPPNTTTTTALTSMTAGTSEVCGDFDIHPVVAGTFS